MLITGLLRKGIIFLVILILKTKNIIVCEFHELLSFSLLSLCDLKYMNFTDLIMLK